MYSKTVLYLREGTPHVPESIMELVKYHNENHKLRGKLTAHESNYKMNSQYRFLTQPSS